MRRHFQRGWTHFWRQLAKVLRNPIFFTLTLVGNFMLVVCASLFYLVEGGTNSNVKSYGDALWWAFVTITTVGYGDTIPATLLGRCVAVLLMLTGGVLFLAFIALLGGAFIEIEFFTLEREVRELRARIDLLIAESSRSRPGESPKSNRDS